MILIIVGAVLIGLQILSFIGNIYSGTAFDFFTNVTSVYALLYDLLGFCAYNFVGFIGLFLLIIGLVKKHKHKNSPKDTPIEYNIEQDDPLRMSNMQAIIIGIVMIVLQIPCIMAFVGMGEYSFFQNVTSVSVFMYDLARLLTYNLIGTIGIVFIIIGVKRNKKK